MPIVRIEKPEVFVGMDGKKAEAEIAEHGYECRIMHVDGRTIHLGLKPDYDPLRVNLWVTKGKVTKATIG